MKHNLHILPFSAPVHNLTPSQRENIVGWGLNPDGEILIRVHDTGAAAPTSVPEGEIDWGNAPGWEGAFPLFIPADVLLGVPPGGTLHLKRCDGLTCEFSFSHLDEFNDHVESVVHTIDALA